jgi:uncharacterized protein
MIEQAGYDILARSRPDSHRDSEAFASLFLKLLYNRLSAKKSAQISCPACLFLKAVFSFLIISLGSLWLCSFAYALEVPQLQGYVNDYANMISPSVKAGLENELNAFEQSDSTQIVILTIPSLEGEVIEEFGIKVGDAWKIGQKAKDNGLIFIVSKLDRKMRIEVGRGLEGRMTDLTAGRIIDLVIKPRFKRGDYDGGFTSGVHAMIDAVRGEFKTEPNHQRQRHDNFASVITLLIFGSMIILFLGNISRVLGGVAGAAIFSALSRLIPAPIGTMGLIIAAIAGFAAGLFLPSLFSSGSRSRRNSGFWMGGPGYGGGFGGGGFGGGGFSGGGGGFGGGGASGSW